MTSEYSKTFAQLSSVTIFLTSFFLGCSTLRVNEKESRELSTNNDYDQAIKVEEAPVFMAAPAFEPNKTSSIQVSNPEKKAGTSSSAAPQKMSSKKAQNLKTPPVKSVKNQSPVTTNELSPATQSATATNKPTDTRVVKPKVHEPSQLEDGEGFDGRRPLVDPYRVGEKVTYAVRYWKVDAGTMSLETMTPKYVNQKLSYHHHLEVKSRDSFNWIYSVNDKADLFVDFDTMVPFSYVIKVDETNQVGENRCLFDWPTMNAKLWEKLKKKDKGIEEKVFDWKLEPFSQNVLSLPVYLRAFKLTPGKKFSIPFGHRGSNMLFGVNVLRKETLETDAGTFPAVVIKPTLKIDGAFKPIGEVFLWFSDDEQKLLLKIEAEIKIGTIRAEAIQVQRGTAPIAVLAPAPAATTPTVIAPAGATTPAATTPASATPTLATPASATPTLAKPRKKQK